MRRCGMLLVAGLLVILWAFPGAAIALCDYVSPSTSLARMRLSFTYRYFDDGFTEGVDVSAGRSRLDYSSLYDSASLGYSLSAVGELRLSQLRISGGTARSSGTLRYYFGEEDPFFAFAGMSMGLDPERLGPSLDVSTGLGYGRFTDVTPLAKAMRIERMLLTRGALPVALPDPTVMTVAEEIGRRVEYPTIDDLVQVLVSAIEEAANVRLDARAVLAIEDQVLATGDERHCGWAVQGGLSYEVLDPREGPRHLLLSLTGAGALPPTPESQILMEAGLTGPANIVAQHTATLSASYEYAAGALDVNAALRLRREKEPDEVPEDTAAASLEVAFPVGGANVTFQLAVTKSAAAPRASLDLNVSVLLRLI